MKVAIYLSAVPKAKNEINLAVLNRFASGVFVNNDSVELVTDYNTVSSDVAVIQGFVHEDITSPHLRLRKNVLDSNNRTIVIDSNLFQFADPNRANYYLRYSLNGVFPTTGFYFDNSIDTTRWPIIQKTLNIKLKDYRLVGDHILICLQRIGGWSLQSADLQQWLDTTIEKLQMYSDRKIIVRKHPGDRAQSQVRLKYKNVEFASGQSLVDDLSKAWATITYNSSPGIASIVNGVPVFVTDPKPQNSQLFPVCDTDLSRIETPTTFDRTELLHRLAQSHWNDEEVTSGAAWKFMRERIVTLK
jgi:hypothetical protein